jgi:predicted negative regulator of RcsB-dependent stress response
VGAELSKAYSHAKLKSKRQFWRAGSLRAVDRQTRKSIKTDKFAQEIGHTFSFLTSHSEESKRYAAIGLAVILVAGGIYFYVGHQATAREQALTDAIRVDEAVINSTPQPPNLNFPTQAAKDEARTKAFSDVAAKYHGSQEGAIAGIYIASDQVDKGNYSQAEKLYKDVVDSAPADYASLARIALSQVYAAEGKNSDAEKMMQSLIDHPTTLVSKEEATLQLADLMIPYNPAKAKKLLEPLAKPDAPGGRTAINQAAISEMGKITQTN